MKILYLHGYQGKLTDDKRSLLEGLGELYAPQLDYDQGAKLFTTLYNEVKVGRFDICIGTSLGGLFALLIANNLKLPCLMFNPAVTYLSLVKEMLPKEYVIFENDQPVTVVSGVKDEVIPYAKQVALVKMLQELNVDVNHYSIENLDHGITFPVFKTYVELFFNKKPV